MQRPFALVGFTYLFALIFSVYFGAQTAFILAISFLSLFIIALFFKKLRDQKTIPVAFLAASIAFFSYSICYMNFIKPSKQLHDKTANISGIVCDLPYQSNGKFYYLIKTNFIDQQNCPQNIKIRMSSTRSINADAFDRVSLKVHMFLPNETSQTTSLSYYTSKGINILAYMDEGYEEGNEKVETAVNFPPYYYLLKARAILVDATRNILPSKLSSIANGMLLSDKYDVDEDVKLQFSQTGVSHLMAVSGLHMSIITQFLLLLFVSVLRISKRYATILTCLGILLFMGITGFLPSVVRSGIMSIIYLLGLVFSRKPDSLNSLGFATLIICVLNPFIGGDIGLLLSFFATLGIIIFYKSFNMIIKNCFLKITQHKLNSENTMNLVDPLSPEIPKFTYTKNKFSEKVLLFLSSAIAVTLAATVLTLPFNIIVFKRFSIISPISNLLVVGPSSIMIPCILIAAILSLCGPLSLLSKPFAFIAGLLIKYILFCLQFLAALPFSSILVSQPFVRFWLFGTLFLFGITIFIQKKNELFKLASILSSILLLIGIFSYQFTTRNLSRLAVLDIGEGCSIILTKNDHAALLSCGGDKTKTNIIKNYLNANNINKLDYMIIPNYNDTTSLYAENILKEYSPQTLILADNEKLDEKIPSYLLSEKTSYYFDQSAKTDLWENIHIEAKSLNNKGWINLKINDINTLICTGGGDASLIDAEFINCDLFITNKLPENYQLINPAYTFLSNSRKGCLEDLKEVLLNESNAVATAEDGNILIDFYSKNKLSISREK